MAVRPVTFCDKCPAQEATGQPVLPTFFTKEGQELCFSCALLELRVMYGLPIGELVPVDAEPKKPEPLPPDTAAFVTRRQELATEHDADIYPIKPAVLVTPGLQIEHGNPKRRVEVIEPVKGQDGVWFAKILA